jgi:hypothetical protein
MCTIKQTIKDLRLRAKIIRKSRSVGCIPGGDEMVSAVPVGHGSKKLKREALDEMVLRAMDALCMKADKVSRVSCSAAHRDVALGRPTAPKNANSRQPRSDFLQTTLTSRSVTVPFLPP